MIVLEPPVCKDIPFGKKMSLKAAMKIAILEACQGLGHTSPNPPVGCVILDKDYQFLAKGHHKAYGSAHAEIEALKKIKNKALLKKAHIFVTLEPCAHQGKTPPCIKTLLKYSFASLTYGQQDPNPETQGRSLKLLKTQGVTIKKFHFFQEDIKELYEIFSFNMKFKKPFVGLKVASSLDGMVAFSDGHSQWITCKESRNCVAFLRACYDGVLIGRDTFLQDNPRLNSRHSLFHDKINKVVILDPKGQCGAYILNSRLMEVRKAEDIILVTYERKSISKRPFPVITLPQKMSGNKHFHLESLLSQLYKEFHFSSLLVEGGASVFSSFVAQNQIQRLYQFIGPVIIGGVKGRSWTERICLNAIKKPLVRSKCLKIGDSVLITGQWLPDSKK